MGANRLSHAEIFQLGNFLKDLSDECLPFPSWDVCLAYIKSKVGFDVTQCNLESMLEDVLSGYDIQLVSGRRPAKSNAGEIDELRNEVADLMNRFEQLERCVETLSFAVLNGPDEDREKGTRSFELSSEGNGG